MRHDSLAESEHSSRSFLIHVAFHKNGKVKIFPWQKVMWKKKENYSRKGEFLFVNKNDRSVN